MTSAFGPLTSYPPKFFRSRYVIKIFVIDAIETEHVRTIHSDFFYRYNWTLTHFDEMKLRVNVQRFNILATNETRIDQ